MSQNDLALLQIKEELARINNKLERMDSHIDFIHKVYSYVQHPLAFICKKVAWTSGAASPSQPPAPLPSPSHDSLE